MSATGLEWIAILSAALFTAWAIYVTLVEHPARLAAGPAAGGLAVGAVIPFTLAVFVARVITR